MVKTKEQTLNGYFFNNVFSLSKVLETAKILKIKGLTEMPDSTSLTRSQGASTDFPNTESSNETNRPSVSPSSPNIKRKRYFNDTISINNCGMVW